MNQPSPDPIGPHPSTEAALRGRRQPGQSALNGDPRAVLSVSPDKRLLAPDDLAAYLGLPVKTLYQWRYKGIGPPGLRIGRHVRYRPEDVDAWLRRLGDLEQRGDVA
ncbi:MAG: helix-turn-helix transcriptional regulator [Acidimicrobiia bacterium]